MCVDQLAGHLTCGVGDVVIFVGAEQDVPAPLESQALYQIISQKTSNPTQAGKPALLLFGVRYYGGGGRISVVPNQTGGGGGSGRGGGGERLGAWRRQGGKGGKQGEGRERERKGG